MMEAQDAKGTAPVWDVEQRLVAIAQEIMDVHSVQRARQNRLGDCLELRGTLRVPADAAYEYLAPRFEALSHVALLRRDGQGQAVLAVPGRLPSSRTGIVLPAIFFVATVLSTLFVGADHPIDGPLGILSGWPFAASLLGILLAHEMGHFVVARRLGVPSSLPYFIPFPLSILGTLGAMIRLKAPPRNRRHLLAVAVAGPLAGLAVAIPVLLVGLRLSEVMRVPEGALVFQEGNSLLYVWLKLLVFGRMLPGGGEDVFLHPVALAGWAGLLVTALNLLPAGQLDGGHVVHSVLGDRAKWLTYAVIVVLLALSVLWQGWMIWAALIFVFGRVRLEPLDDCTELRPFERALAILLMIVFLLVFTPIPMS